MGRNNTSKRGRLPKPAVHFSEATLTQYAGAVPLLHFLNDRLELPQQLAFALGCDGRTRRHPQHLVLFAFLAGAMVGAVKLAHVEWLGHDRVFTKFLRFSSWPVRKVFSAALESVTDAGVVALSWVLTGLGLRSVANATSAVLDFDSTALRCFGTQAGAVFGYCGKGRNRRRHHPLVASVAQTRAVVHAKYRDGSGIGEQESIAFIAESVSRLRGRLASGAAVSVRADSGFWSRATGEWLVAQKVPFTISMPLMTSLKLLLMGVTFKPVVCTEPCPGFEPEEGEQLDDVDIETGEEIEVGVLGGEALGYDASVRIVVLRRRVFDPKAPPPGKVVGWSPDWRYQAIVTNTDWEPLDVWRFYNDRGDAERVFKVGKHALGLGWFVSQVFRANEVAFLLRLMAWNADVLYQMDADERAERAERPVVRTGLQARQQYLYRLPGRLLHAAGRWELRLPAAAKVEALWRYFSSDPGSPRTSTA